MPPIALLIAVPGLLGLGTAPPATRRWTGSGTIRSSPSGPDARPALGLGATARAWPALIGVGLLWALATRYAVRIDPLLGTPVTAALALLAVPAGWAWRCGWRRWGGPVARGLILVGRNTLPIYVLHPLVMRVFFLVFQRPEPLPRTAWVLLVTAVAVVVSCLLGRLLGRIPGLFGLPPLPAGLAAAAPAGAGAGYRLTPGLPPASRLHGRLAHSPAGAGRGHRAAICRGSTRHRRGTQPLGFAIAPTPCAW